MRHLRLIRQLHSLSQNDLGKLTGFKQEYLSNLERGLAVSNPEHVARIASALGVTEAVLFAEAVIVNADGHVEAVRATGAPS